MSFNLPTDITNSKVSIKSVFKSFGGGEKQIYQMNASTQVENRYLKAEQNKTVNENSHILYWLQIC